MTVHHAVACIPQIKTVLVGVTYMTAFYFVVGFSFVSAGLGYLFGKLGLSGIKADIAAIKAKIEPTPVAVVATPVVS